MPNGNGKSNSWVRWVLGILIISVLPFMVGAIWSNDKDSRKRDTDITEKVHMQYKELKADIHKGRLEQAADSQEMKISQARIMEKLGIIQ